MVLFRQPPQTRPCRACITLDDPFDWYGQARRVVVVIGDAAAHIGLLLGFLVREDTRIRHVGPWLQRRKVARAWVF